MAVLFKPPMGFQEFLSVLSIDLKFFGPDLCVVLKM